VAAEEMPMVSTDAGLETVLLFGDGLELSCFAAFPLLDGDEGGGVLRRYYEPFLRLARDRNTALMRPTGPPAPS
jgi:hypothetical protein